MKKLVIQWKHGDDCTYSCTLTQPVLYESAEAFLVEFEDAVVQAMHAGVAEFTFANIIWNTHEFTAFSFIYDCTSPVLPAVAELDEWFEINCQAVN